MDVLDQLRDLGVTVTLDGITGQLRARPVPVPDRARDLIRANRDLIAAVLEYPDPEARLVRELGATFVGSYENSDQIQAEHGGGTWGDRPVWDLELQPNGLPVGCTTGLLEACVVCDPLRTNRVPGSSCATRDADGQVRHPKHVLPAVTATSSGTDPLGPDGPADWVALGAVGRPYGYRDSSGKERSKTLRHVWARCDVCGEGVTRAKSAGAKKCVITHGCEGKHQP